MRSEVSGPDAPRHAAEMVRHAIGLGYQYVYTVRPPEGHADPIGFAVSVAVGIHAAALVVYDLATVGNTPSRVCDSLDLETVYPPETWAAATPADPAHAYPAPITSLAEASRIMQQHIACLAVLCPRKSLALHWLVRAGRVAPQTRSPRERAAARGIPFPPLPDDHPLLVGADARLLLEVLDGLTDPEADAAQLMTRLSPLTRD
ncbi:hypothetical protein EBN03_29920 [Nocardia stercoris]|uniref:Uncharacterized protein n=1 Tax=Nocardia stercoris TaxID=2483361 RepID=A0A3M2KY34_9NOCA|nr:hypothetical protein EBN03_29920 [Nocardia stercoris]